MGPYFKTGNIIKDEFNEITIVGHNDEIYDTKLYEKDYKYRISIFLLFKLVNFILHFKKGRDWAKQEDFIVELYTDIFREKSILERRT